MCLTSSIVIMTVSCCKDILPSKLKVFGLTYVGRTWTSFFLLPECVTEKKKVMVRTSFYISYGTIEENLLKPL